MRLFIDGFFAAKTALFKQGSKVPVNTSYSFGKLPEKLPRIISFGSPGLGKRDLVKESGPGLKDSEEVKLVCVNAA